MMNSKIYFLTIILALLVVINVFFVLSSPKQNNYNSLAAAPVSNSSQAYIFPISEPSYFPILNTGIQKPLIDAKSALVYDTRSGRYLYSRNTQEKLPIASLTKILSAVVVIEKLNLKDVVVVPKEALKVDDEKQTLYLGESITVENLLKLMLIESSNDAAYALAWQAKQQNLDFLALMNDKAVSIGMTNSHFLDPAGLNDNAYSTGEDLVKLANYSLRYNLIWDFTSQKNITVRSSDGVIEHVIESTDQLLGVIQNIRGGKTGYTEGASGCMILIVEIPGKNDRLISIVLGSRERFTDTKKLINWTQGAYRWE